MFLDNLITRRAEIVEPWNKYKKEGNSFFLWNLSLLFIVIALIALGIGFKASRIIDTVQPKHITSIVLTLMLTIFLLGLVLGYLYLFLNSFVLPLMYKHRETANQAWRRFLPLLNKHLSSFLLFGLFRFLLCMAVGVVLIGFSLLTCCCGLFLLSAPYIGTVLMLPYYVFSQYFNIEFLKQFGPEFNLDQTTTPEPPPLNV